MTEDAKVRYFATRVACSFSDDCGRDGFSESGVSHSRFRVQCVASRCKADTRGFRAQGIPLELLQLVRD